MKYPHISKTEDEIGEILEIQENKTIEFIEDILIEILGTEHSEEIKNKFADYCWSEISKEQFIEWFKSKIQKGEGGA